MLSTDPEFTTADPIFEKQPESPAESSARSESPVSKEQICWKEAYSMQVRSYGQNM
jgi:hypothetical protein